MESLPLYQSCLSFLCGSSKSIDLCCLHTFKKKKKSYAGCERPLPTFKIRFLPAFRQMDSVVLQSDALRAFILHSYGGLYLVRCLSAMARCARCSRFPDRAQLNRCLQKQHTHKYHTHNHTITQSHMHSHSHSHTHNHTYTVTHT